MSIIDQEDCALMLEPSPATELIEAFVNTVDLESGEDDIATPAELTRWLADRGLAEAPPRLSTEDHASFLTLRAGIREALDVEAPVSPHRLALADAALAGVPVLVTVSRNTWGDHPRPLAPAPGQTPAGTALAQLGIAWTEVVLTGQIQRLKRCAEHTCGWVFWDASKNHSRRWCSMRVCGNRTKSRRYTARHRMTAAD